MLFLGFISGKRIRFPGKWAKTLKNPGSLTSTQTYLSASPAGVRVMDYSPGCPQAAPWHRTVLPASGWQSCREKPRKILMLGLGGGTLQSLLQDQCPATEVAPPS